MIKIYDLLTRKEKIDHEQFFIIAESHYSLRRHDKKLVKKRSKLDTRKSFNVVPWSQAYCSLKT